jgi:hypothetical protein
MALLLPKSGPDTSSEVPDGGAARGEGIYLFELGAAGGNPGGRLTFAGNSTTRPELDQSE